MKHLEPSEGANRKRLRILAWRGHRKPELLGSAHRWTRLRMHTEVTHFVTKVVTQRLVCICYKHITHQLQAYYTPVTCV